MASWRRKAHEPSLPQVFQTLSNLPAKQSKWLEELEDLHMQCKPGEQNQAALALGYFSDYSLSSNARAAVESIGLLRLAGLVLHAKPISEVYSL